jgi:hypothetical protein
MKREIVQGVVKFLSSAGTSAVVRNIVRATTPPGLSLVNKILVVIGEVAVTGVLSDLASDRVDAVFEDTFPKKQQVKENKEYSKATLEQARSAMYNKLFRSTDEELLKDWQILVEKTSDFNEEYDPGISLAVYYTALQAEMARREIIFTLLKKEK